MGTDINGALAADMAAKGIDIALTASILDDLNAGLYDGVAAVEVSGVPPVDGIVDRPVGRVDALRAPREGRD
ncbi:MAG: hypothetical protein M0C28_26300 [Candidatus Moduliflexus flocculans]|nr:hypothetical protein [Candidatus Moduliflexus flocculans]